MERTSLRRDQIIRDKWESNSLIFEGDNLANHGFSSSPIIWPQRNYTCSFCKRDFNSAQALGGHMNVHRRDRAMLMQLPPSFVFKQHLIKSNPSSPNFSSCSSSLTNLPLPPPRPKYLVPYSHTRLPLVSPSPSRHGKKCTTFSPPIEELKKEKSIRRPNLELLIGEFNKGSAKRFALDQEVSKEDDHREVISLDLEMGFKDPKEALDLELRLGCF